MFEYSQLTSAETASNYENSFSNVLGQGKTVRNVTEARLPTKFGEFRLIGYRSSISSEDFVILVKGEIKRHQATLVRIHSQCLTGDVFGSTKCDCGQQLNAAMRLIAEENCGVIVYQQQEGRGIGIINKIRAYALQDKGADTIEANEELGLAVDLRCYEQCAEILADLGLGKVRLMTNNPEKLRSIEKAGLKVKEHCQKGLLPRCTFEIESIEKKTNQHK